MRTCNFKYLSRCGVAFAQKASLKDHENVHLKKFECKGCAKAFGRDRYLKLHMRTCNRLNPEERGFKRRDPRPKSKKDDRKVEDVGGEDSKGEALDQSLRRMIG